MDVPLIDFIELDEVIKQLRDQAKTEHPDKKLVPFWRLYLRDGIKLVISAPVDDGTVGVKERVELVKELKHAS